MAICPRDQAMTPSPLPDPIPLVAAAVSATLATVAIAVAALAAATFLVRSAPAEDASTPAAVVALFHVQEKT